MALTEGQCVELDVLASLVAAVRAARERTGTLGMEQRGAGPLSAAVPVHHPRLAVDGDVCANYVQYPISCIPPGTYLYFHGVMRPEALCSKRVSSVY